MSLSEASSISRVNGGFDFIDRQIRNIFRESFREDDEFELGETFDFILEAQALYEGGSSTKSSSCFSFYKGSSTDDDNVGGKSAKPETSIDNTKFMALWDRLNPDRDGTISVKQLIFLYEAMIGLTL